MKVSNFTLITLLLFVGLFENSFSLTTSKSNMRISKTGIRISLEELANARMKDASFDPNRISKYFKRQKPPQNKSEMFIDPFFPPNSNSIEGKTRMGTKSTKVQLNLQIN